MNHTHKRVLTFLCLASICVLSLFVFLQFSTAISSENSSILKYELNDVFVGNLKQVVQINNTQRSKVVGGKLFVPLIRNETARHYVILYNISSSSGQPTILSDGSGNMYAYWSDIEIDREQKFTIEINYHILSFNIRYLINSSLIADYNESSDLYKKYTQPEELIESDNFNITLTTQTLIGSETNAQEKVIRIHDLVIRHLQYEVQDEERGAQWALENGRGDCSEYSYLFVALCRAAGIPARVQAGFAFPPNNETIHDGHMWAEYYLENYGWVPVDATWGLFNAMDYSHFGSIQSMPEVIPYSNYFFNNTIGPEPEDEQIVELKEYSPNAFGNDSFAENIVETIQKIEQAESTLFLGRVLGAPLIFSSETENTTQTLLESRIHLQSAIDLLENAQSNAASALESAEKASQNAWMLIVKVFAIFISTPAIIMLTALVFLRRHRSKYEKTF